MSHKLYNLSPYAYVRNNPLNRFDPDGFVDWPTFWKGTAKFSCDLAGTIGAGYYCIQTVRVGGALSGGFVLVTSLTTMNLGLIDMISGLQDKTSALQDGILIPVLMGTGMDRQTALTVNLLYDMITLLGNVHTALSKTGTTLTNYKYYLIQKQLQMMSKK
ncbi:MAG: hypothetical protein JXB44_09065 [Calditrichaceae bacterium]|nr:hypothetical protein [Calditrichaceae bacterium]RQV94653.1 MAG: hypothetical protein EH224_09530 [Calditrichota bacterium]